jgi:drug/metabolite transporter superfamily protein YnfA
VSTISVSELSEGTATKKYVPPTLLRRYNGLVFLSAILSVTAFLVADERVYFLPPALLLLAGAWLAARRARSEGQRWALPPVVVNLLVFGVIVNAALRTVAGTSGEPVVSTLGGFLAFVLLIKTFDRRSARDDAQLLTLCVFVTIAAVLTSNTLIVGACVALFTPITVAAAMLWQVQSGMERARPEGSSHVMVTESTRPRDRAAVRHFRMVCGAAVLGSAAFAVAVFLFTPRGIGGDALGRFGMTREKQIGFREEVRLGEAGLLSPNPTPVMDVNVSLLDGTNAGSSQQILYMRGGARDKYDLETMTWEDSTPVAKGSVATIEADTRWTVPSSEKDPGAGVGRVTLQSSSRTSSVRVVGVTMRSAPTGGNLFGLWRPVDVLCEQRLALGYSELNRTIRKVESNPGRLSYTMRCLIAEEPARRPEMELGFGTGRIHDLTEDLLKSKGVVGEQERSSRGAASVIRDYLRTAGSYTTEMVAPPSDTDAIEYFLFTSKRGHCEYFASAMAAMCQSVGIPARVAVGYVVTEYNPLNGQYLVRESNAHAWVEAFVVSDVEKNVGRWELFDPSPPGDIERIHRPASGMFASLRGWYEALEFRWSSSIVGFDTVQQSKIFGREASDRGPAATQINSWADGMARWMRGSRRGRDRGQWAFVRTVQDVMPYVLGVGFVGIGIYAGRYAWKHRRPGRRAGREHLDAEMALLLKRTGFYPRALAVLEKFGRGKPAGVPPMKFARRMSERAPGVAQRLGELAELYYRVRFGRAALTDADMARARVLVESLGAELRATGR